MLLVSRQLCQEDEVVVARLKKKLVPPGFEVLKGLLSIYIVHQNAAVRSSIKRDTKALEPFLSSCVPDLRASSSAPLAPKACLHKDS